MLEIFRDEKSEINPYYPRFKSHELEINEENNILKDTELNCINGQLLFGSFSFYSKEGQQKYEYNNDLKIKFVKKYVNIRKITIEYL